MDLTEKLLVVVFVCVAAAFVMLPIAVIGRVTHGDKTEKEVVTKPKVEDSASRYCRYVKFDGHEHVLYERTIGYGNTSGLAHSPNCPCVTNNAGALR